MALPSMIPTSFVPNSSPAARRGFHIDFSGVFEIIAYSVVSITFLIAVGVFFYGRILIANKSAKDTTLAAAESAFDPVTVVNFVRLRNRLNSSKELIANHIALSGFFSVIEKVLPSNVRFASLNILVDSTGTGKISGSGVAKSFNALAATSGALASDGRIKDAIFSKITVNKDNSVSFGFSATLSPGIIAFSPDMTSLGTPQTSTLPSP